MLEGLQQKHETLEASCLESTEEKAVLEESHEELKKGVERKQQPTSGGQGAH